MQALKARRQPGELRFTFDAGVFVRGSYVAAVREIAWCLDLELELQEDKHLLDSTYFAKLTGDEEDIQKAIVQLGRLA